MPLMTTLMTTLSSNNIFVVSYESLFQRILLRIIRLFFFIIRMTYIFNYCVQWWHGVGMSLSCNNMFDVLYDTLFQRIVLHNIRLFFFIIWMTYIFNYCIQWWHGVGMSLSCNNIFFHIARYLISTHSFVQYQIIFLHYSDEIYFELLYAIVTWSRNVINSH